MYIHGIGIISNAGRGMDPFCSLLTTQDHLTPSDGFLRVSDSDLKDPLIAKEARRASRFDRMAILAGIDALNDAKKHQAIDPFATALILASGYGPHVTTFRFLDDIIDFNEKDVSPTLFSHSVHNAAASYLSLLGNIRAATLTVTHFSSAFNEAILLAECWLKEKRARYVIVGAVDELGVVMDKILLSQTPNACHLGEGSLFFVLSQEPSTGYDISIASINAFIKDNSMLKTLVSKLFGQQPCIKAYEYAVSIMVLSGKIHLHQLKEVV